MNNTQKSFHSGRAIFFLMVFVCIIIGAAVLKIASSVILPFTIAAFLAFVMFPLIKALDKIKCPRILSILLVLVIIISGMYVFGIVLFNSGRMIVEQYPQYEGRIKTIYDGIASLFDLPNDEAVSIWQNLWDQEAIRSWVRDVTITFSNISVRFLSSAVLVVLFMVFILLEAGIFRKKLTNAFRKRIGRIDRMGNEVITQVSRYLGAKFLISLANGVIFAVAFYFIGLEFAIVWGVLQFLLNFIPTLGSIVAGVIISLFALLQFWPNPAPIILIVAIVLSVNMILGNMLDPKIIGDHLGISPLIILASLSIWGYIWGFAGMVIAVPMTVIIKIICENIPIMKPVSILLGSRKSVKDKKAKHNSEPQSGEASSTEHESEDTKSNSK
ncbi:MAG: AI-2E family transporter [Treponema sp.]|nr:AI-2E family transporter [Treponema sp.]MCL2250437.1 AI-2E family transporter [Treponema sp.]